jgi:hypothetical protein
MQTNPMSLSCPAQRDQSPCWTQNEQGQWVRKTLDQPLHAPDYRIDCYRPRIEGQFARIERWTEIATGEVHWRTLTRDNLTTLYGRDNASRIFDPASPDPEHPTRIYSWLICASYDDKGNAIVYQYAQEDAGNVEPAQANERNRVRTANRYLKRISMAIAPQSRQQDPGDGSGSTSRRNLDVRWSSTTMRATT